MSREPQYECIIIGAGPAGLSAAVYMGRFLRKTLVIDDGSGRSSFAQVNDNYLGFPGGVKVADLRDLGRKQAERFGVTFVDATVDRLKQEDDTRAFVAEAGGEEHSGRTVILCTGVTDIWPNLPNVLDYVGKSMFSCITCDGFKAVDRPVVLFGKDDESAVTACQFLAYTDQLTLVFEPGKLDCSRPKILDLERNGIALLEGEVERVHGTPERITGIAMRDGREVKADLMFSLLGCEPNSKLALDLGVESDEDGYIKVDQEGYTSVKGVFCAGDLSRMHTHQVVAAAHEGAEAAQTANYWLYSSFQRHEPKRLSEPELQERVRSSE